MAQSRIRGANRLRRKLRGIDALTGGEVGEAIETAAKAIHADALARVPQDEGDLVRAIEFSTSSDKLSATIGPAAKTVRYIKKQGFSVFANRSTTRQLRETTKERLFQVFKGFWIERGTKGHVISTKNKQALSDGDTFFGREVTLPPQPPRPFMEPAYDVNKSWAVNMVRRAVGTAIRKASGVR